MRYKLDASGYVCAVSFGCYLDDCTEYTGEIPAGYKDLNDWASNACIQAYYIDPNGNLVLDYARKTEYENRQAQEVIDYAPVLRKDLYGTDEVLDSQYIRRKAIGKVITLEDIKTVAPRVKITGIEPGYNKLSIYTQGKNMMPCDAVAGNILGVTFTKNASGSITVLGTATEDIEYIVSDGKATPIFALKGNHDYYLNLGGLQCELRYYDGETTAQQYVGASGLLNLPESIEVTQVVIKIASGDSVNTTFYPQLEYGPKFTSYETHKCKSLEIDISEYGSELVLPSDTLYAKDTLYPGVIGDTIDYIIIENGKVTISVNREVHVLGIGSVGLFSAYSTIYATKDVMLEIEYSDNLIDVDSLEFLQGKATTTNQFKILKDGSIEAHNGFFSGRIEAESGYFKGEISWDQVTDNENVATKTYVTGLGYQTAPQVTKITKDTVTTQFVNALNVKAGSVDAECITGDIISGKRLQGVTGDFKGKIEADSGKIGGFTIASEGIYNGKTSFNSSAIGVYIGKDGIAVGYNNAFRVDSTGKMTLGSLSELTIDGNIDCRNYKGGIEYMGNLRIMFDTSRTEIRGLTACLGEYDGRIGFFGTSSGASRYNIAKLSTSTSDISRVVTQFNKLLDALNAYNLLHVSGVF